MSTPVVLDVEAVMNALLQHASTYTDLDAKAGQRIMCSTCRQRWSLEHQATAIIAAVQARTVAEVKAEALDEAADYIEAGARSFAAKVAFRKARSKSEGQRNARTGHRAAGQISVARTLRSRAYQLRKDGDA